jgi:hypothetical protein
MNGLLVLKTIKKEVLHIILAQLIKKLCFTPRPKGEIQDGRHTGLTYQLAHEHLGYFSRLWAY